MTYSGTSQVSQKTKSCRVKNDTKIENSEFLILVFPQLF